MKIILIGANGTIGKIITPALVEKYEVVTVGRKSGDIVVDISSLPSIENLFQGQSSFDAVICVAGDSVTDALTSITEGQFEFGVKQKLLSQINIVLVALEYINDNGCLTLISGKMGEKPAKGSLGKAVVNGAVNSFVLAASLEMPRGIRINVISPCKVSDIAEGELITAYLRCLETSVNGEIIRIGYN